MHFDEAKKLLEQCERHRLKSDPLPEHNIKWSKTMFLWTEKGNPDKKIAEGRSGINKTTTGEVFRVHIYKDKTSFEGVVAFQLISYGTKV